MHPFIKTVLGRAGASALEKIAKADDGIESYLLPRAIVAWLNTLQKFEGFVPGTEDIPLLLHKTEHGWCGAISNQHQTYGWTNAPETHVAATICVFTGTPPGRPDLREVDLARLGQTVERLAKAQKVRGAGEGAAGMSLPAANIQPVPPEAVEDYNTKTPARELKVTLPGMKKLKKPKPAMKPLKVSKSQADSNCEVCGSKSFQGNEYVGCHCLKDLSKSVKTYPLPLNVGFRLEFGSGWGEDEVLTLAESLGIR